MNLQQESSELNPRYEECVRLHDCWLWFLALGIALIVVGALAIGASVIATLTSVLVFGIGAGRSRRVSFAQSQIRAVASPPPVISVRPSAERARHPGRAGAVHARRKVDLSLRAMTPSANLVEYGE
jgi:hypothetical protein